ncbi:MAG: ABC transporter ATP-binding protein [Chloroflexi bacterium]|nr:ABC transporter ATP-binding protein [Chloroflexota bacterium]
MIPKIEVRNLSKSFSKNDVVASRFVALNSVNFQVQDQEFVCVLGPSGCGKSTMLNIIGGLEESYEGEVFISGKSIRNADRDRYRVGYIFQEPRLLPWLTLEENICFALEGEGIPKSDWKRITQQCINVVRLTGFEKYYPYQLSGGMQQRTSIARSFAVDPDILLMDEPFSGLDEITARRLRRELLSIWRQMRKTVIFVTHNSLEATYLADRILLMTRSPGVIYQEITVNLPRPRSYDSSSLFELNQTIVKDFLKHIGEEDEEL